jgi:hypothetical protein
MKYSNGVEVKIGDGVRSERGETSGTVEAIIDSNFADWSVDELGVMLLSAPFCGCLFPHRCSSAMRLGLSSTQRGAP